MSRNQHQRERGRKLRAMADQYAEFLRKDPMTDTTEAKTEAKPKTRFALRRGAKTLLERFIQRVEVQPGDACWLWRGQIVSTGYGVLELLPGEKPRPRRAHRIAWMLEHGEVPADLFVCHRCDVRNCVRPSHLFLGTMQDNIDDRTTKGRGVTPRHRPEGEANASAKLTAESVRAIRLRLTAGFSQSEIARMFGVTPSTIRRIANGEAWRVA